jgi:signal peptidase II
MSDAAEPAAEAAEPADGPGDRRPSLFVPVMIATAVVIIDQLTKAWALRALDDRNIDVFWTLQFNLAFNTGMAFSQGRGLGPVIGVVALLVVVVLLVRLGREGGRWAILGTGLVLGGALGNIADRMFRDEGWLRGAVVDFIDLQWFPIFNVADMAITVGGGLLLFTALRGTEPSGTSHE